MNPCPHTRANMVCVRHTSPATALIVIVIGLTIGSMAMNDRHVSDFTISTNAIAKPSAFTTLQRGDVHVLKK
jgi:hypothetical protein